MGKEILVDTDILLKSYRGDKFKFRQLELIGDISISVITALEIINGAKNIKQLASVKKELKAYSIIHLNPEISSLTLQLYSRYAVQKQMKVADLLIGAQLYIAAFSFILITKNILVSSKH